MTFSLASMGYVRTAVAVPELRVADVEFNTKHIIDLMDQAVGRKVQIILFPELCITAYTCGDLFYQTALLRAAERALLRIVRHSAVSGISVVVGLPLSIEGRLFNCAALLAEGKIAGIVPKRFLPNRNEFYEERWFSSAGEQHSTTVTLGGLEAAFGSDLLFQVRSNPDCTFGIEICEDLWSVAPPSGPMALAGATVLLNPSHSNELLGKAAYRRSLVTGQSARCLAAYVYTSSGPGESSTDTVCSGHAMVSENGTLLTEIREFSFAGTIAVADIDVSRLITERLNNNSFSSARTGSSYRRIDIELPSPSSAAASFPESIERPVLKHPFVPASPESRAEVCREIFVLQSTGLARRLRQLGDTRAVIGVSGGLDSTLALLVTAAAFDKLGRSRSEILTLTLPGFGTTDRTRSNAQKLAELLGCSFRSISIDAAVRRHFRDIGHDEAQRDVTYENAQARERTQILMDIANKENAIVIGTGDLSELALGWCTYNADQMSMYNVNAGLPKTLVRTVVLHCADNDFSGASAAVLRDICETPVSPELLPPEEQAQGLLPQLTEAAIGPYELHDFFLYHFLRFHFTPAKIFVLARLAYGAAYSAGELLRWLRVFYRRFFSQQFKRSAMPDGPKIGSVALSPRGDWRMPSDAAAALWLHEIEQIADLIEGQDAGVKTQ